jgi:hypothetical protein
MAQLELFSRSQIAAIRDRTASRNYSPAQEAFRREHERHREWGLRQRHGRRLMYLRMYGEAVAPADRTISRPPTQNPTPAPAPPSEPTYDTRPTVAASHPDGREPTHGRDTESSEAHPADETSSAAAAHQDTPAGQAEPIDRLERREREGSARLTPADQPSQAGQRRRTGHATASIPRLCPPGRPRRPGSARSAGRRSVRPGRPARSRRPRPPRRYLPGQEKRSVPTDDRAPPAVSTAPPRPAAGPSPDDTPTDLSKIRSRRRGNRSRPHRGRSDGRSPRPGTASGRPLPRRPADRCRGTLGFANSEVSRGGN